MGVSAWTGARGVDDAYQRALVPGDTGLLVGVGVGVALGLASLTAEETVQVGADLVGATSLDGVALSTASLDDISRVLQSFRIVRNSHLEELGTLGGVTWRKKTVSFVGFLGFLEGL